MPPFSKSKLAKAIAENHINMRQSLAIAAGAIASANAVAVDNNINAVDGYTTVTSSGNTHTVTNDFVKNGTPVNVFNDFVVGDAHTVNLIVPTDADKLVNVVRDSRPEVHGVLNSYQDGSLGGNVVFASSQGFLVGPNGVVNVGGLEIRTPSQSEIDDWVANDFELDAAAEIDELTPLEKLEAGEYTVSSTGLITIQGKITGATGISLNADQVVIDDGGQVIVGKSAVANYVDLSAVNVGDLSAPSALISDNGSFEIVAAGQSGDGATIGGDIYADGGIVIAAEEVVIADTATLDTRDADGDVSGTINITNATNIDVAGELIANEVYMSATNAVTLSANIFTEALDIEKDDDGLITNSTASAGYIEITAADVTVDNSGNDLILADTDDEALVLSAAADDQVIVGNLNIKGNADFTADAIDITAGNSVTTKNVALHASDINLNGALNAYTTQVGDIESTDETISEYGEVHLDGDAKYSDLANITAGLVKVDVAKDVYLADTSAAATSAGATASDLSWVDAAGFNFGFDLDLNSTGNIHSTTNATLSAGNISLTAGGDLTLNDTLTATDSISLSAATFGIDFSKFVSPSLSLETTNAMVFADDAAETAYDSAGLNDF